MSVSVVVDQNGVSSFFLPGSKRCQFALSKTMNLA
jgi:hypothetical protein